MGVVDYKELIIWQKSMDLVSEVYKLVKKLPREENYALSDQIRRASVSIPSNIAEGNSRDSTKEYGYFLSIARGSKYELETQILVCVRLNFFSEMQAELALHLCSEIGKMLNSLIKKLAMG